MFKTFYSYFNFKNVSKRKNDKEKDKEFVRYVDIVKYVHIDMRCSISIYVYNGLTDDRGVQ